MAAPGPPKLTIVSTPRILPPPIRTKIPIVPVPQTTTKTTIVPPRIAPKTPIVPPTRTKPPIVPPVRIAPKTPIVPHTTTKTVIAPPTITKPPIVTPVRIPPIPRIVPKTPIVTPVRIAPKTPIVPPTQTITKPPIVPQVRIAPKTPIVPPTITKPPIVPPPQNIPRTTTIPPPKPPIVPPPQTATKRPIVPPPQTTTKTTLPIPRIAPKTPIVPPPQTITKTPVVSTIAKRVILDPSISTVSLIYVPEPMPNISYPVLNYYSPSNIDTKRKMVYDNLLTQFGIGVNVKPLHQSLLQAMFTAYDDIFFKSSLANTMLIKNYKLQLSVASRLVKTAGMCKARGCEYQINISGTIMDNLFNNGESFKRSNGLIYTDKLSCVMNTFEHELIHFVLFINGLHLKGDPIYKGHGALFQDLARAFFGHTEYKHQYLTTNTSQTVLTRETARIGQYVQFNTKDGKVITDRISKLNPKTANVGLYKVSYQLLSAVDEPTDLIQQQIQSIKSILKPGDIIRAFDPITQRHAIVKVAKLSDDFVDIGYDKISYDNVQLLTPKELHDLNISEGKKIYMVGDLVSFTTREGNVITGTIIKTNPKTAQVATYKVPYHLLRRV